MKNWVYYMQRGLQSMWKSKPVSDLENIIRDRDEIIYDEPKKKKEEKVFEPIDYKECGCLPDCGCKE